MDKSILSEKSINVATKICRLMISQYRSLLQSRFRVGEFTKEERSYSSLHISRIFDIRTVSTKLNLKESPEAKCSFSRAQRELSNKKAASEACMPNPANRNAEIRLASP